MGNCKDCAHFDYRAALSGWGRCDLAENSDGQSLCEALDDEARPAELAVSPNFGCVQFEAKIGG